MDERYCECAYCGIGHHCDEGKDGANCPECGEWNGIINLWYVDVCRNGKPIAECECC